MFELQTCRICLTNKVRLHQISGSEVQYVYEKLTNKVLEDRNLYFACYICYCKLKNCQLVVTKLQKSKELLQQIPINSELHLRQIRFKDRLTHGLVHSLAVTNIESLQIPEYNEFIKTEKQDESDTNEEIVEDGSDVEFGVTAQSLKKIRLTENHNIGHADLNSIESGKKENIFKIEINTATDSNYLSRIVNDEKSKQVLVRKSFICNDCGKTCETKAVLIKHISGHKPMTIELNETNIENCSYTCTDNSSLKTHIRTQTGEKPFKCQYCSYTCTDNNRLKRHIKTHTKEKPLKCQLCHYTCARNSQLQIHISTHTGVKPLKCPYCSYTCTQNGRLKRHITIHTGEKPYKCQFCNYTCARNCALKIHIRSHTQRKPFKCKYCSYTCTQSGHLKIHNRIHTGDKPFKCQYCNFSCAINCNFKRHIRTHTGEKPFKCQFCNYTCSRNSHLENHIKTHTGEKPLKCQYCNYTCIVSYNLKRHENSHRRNAVKL